MVIYAPSLYNMIIEQPASTILEPSYLPCIYGWNTHFQKGVLGYIGWSRDCQQVLCIEPEAKHDYGRGLRLASGHIRSESFKCEVMGQAKEGNSGG